MLESFFKRKLDELDVYSKLFEEIQQSKTISLSFHEAQFIVERLESSVEWSAWTKKLSTMMVHSFQVDRKVYRTRKIGHLPGEKDCELN